jgi:hypothetical protein
MSLLYDLLQRRIWVCVKTEEYKNMCGRVVYIIICYNIVLYYHLYGRRLVYIIICYIIYIYIYMILLFVWQENE